MRTVFAVFFEIFLFVMIFCNLSKFKFGRAEFAKYVIFYAVFHLVGSYLFHDIMGTLLVIIFHVFSILILTAMAYRKTKIITLSGFYGVFTWALVLIANLSGVSFFMVFGFISTFTISEYWDSIIHIVAVYISLTLFSFLFSYIFGNILKNKMSGLDLAMTKKCANYLLGSASIVLFFMWYYMFFRWFISSEMLGFIFLAMMGILVATFIFVISMFTDSVKSALHAQEKEYYFAQSNLMQESVEQIKAMHHDMKMHLATINGYATNINAPEIANYVGSLIENIGEVETYSSTGNIAVDSVINYKLKNAKQKGIKLKTKFLIPPVLNVEATDLSIILGNLLDNALHAISMLADSEEKKIKLDIEFSRGTLVIRLDNSFDGIVNFNENTIITRKDKNHHGHGLKNINKSVEKYNGYMDITHEDKTFSVSILLYVEAAS
ncbi:MAG: GHKL domain-containing protein [Defluviitaleaceae bacterium]|nr:GHKL domain-containing protein [Defluviitaleaceae bacterium]